MSTSSVTGLESDFCDMCEDRVARNKTNISMSEINKSVKANKSDYEDYEGLIKQRSGNNNKGLNNHGILNYTEYVLV